MHRLRNVWPLVAFGALIAFGCALRFWKLTATGLWYDELWTVAGASDRPFAEMYREWMLGDAHPPGFFLFYFAWFKVFPATEFWARIVSALSGVATVAYLLFRTSRVLTRDERVMSAAFMSLSYVAIFYAVSVKQYGPMMLIATVATNAYLGMVAAKRIERRAAIRLCLSCIGLAYLSHFAMVYAWTLLAFLALTFRRHGERRRVAGMAAVFALAYLPIAYFLYLQVRYGIDDWQPYDVRAFVAELMPSLFFADGTRLRWELAIFGVASLGLVVAQRRGGELLRSARNRHLALIGAAFGAFMLGLGVSEPIFYVRYFLILLPAFMIGLGIWTAAAFPLNRPWLLIVPLVFFARAAVAQYHAVDGLQRQQWDRSVDLVLASRTSKEPVYVLGAKGDKTQFDYLRERNVDGLFYVHNLRFYEYYFKRRGANDVASRLQVVEPSVESAEELSAKYEHSGQTVYVLAGHHIQYRDEALARLKARARHVEVTTLVSTLVYRLTF